MNIAFFVPDLSNKGGVERATISLLNSIVTHFGKENNISVILFNKGDYAFDLDSRVKVISLGVTNWKLHYLRLYRRLTVAMKRNNIDVVVSVETMSLLFCFLPIYFMNKSPKLVVWEHFNFKNNNGKKMRDWLRILAAKKADLVVTLTKRDMTTWIRKLNPKSQITYIFNINPFENIKASYKINSKKAIAVGRYVEVKGFDRLINAWSLFEGKYGANDWELEIVGYGDDRDKLQKIINSNNSKSIKLVDGAVGVENFYNNAGLYCMSSYYEGLGMVLIEAQSFAVPSIAFDIYAGPSEILSCGSGILIEDNNIEKYADALYYITTDDKLRVKMSEAALKNSNHFRGYHIADKWINEFKNIL